MSAAEHLQEAIDVGCTRDDHDHVGDHRAEVLVEAAGLIEEWQNGLDDAAALDHGALTDTETAAHIAVRRMAKALRELAAQAPAGEPNHTVADTAPPDRRSRYAAALTAEDPLSAVIAVANDETDPVYRSGYTTGRSHAGAAGWAFDSFEAVISTSGDSYGVAEEYRCRKCGAIGAQGIGPRSLLDLMAMAARHECLPRTGGEPRD